MNAWIGKSLIFMGIGHTFVGIIAFHEILVLLIKERLVNTISLTNTPGKEAAFWFLFCGFSLMIIGGLVDWIESKNIGLPSFLMWSLIPIAVVGALIMPISGFWLFIIPISGLLLREKKK